MAGMRKPGWVMNMATGVVVVAGATILALAMATLYTENLDLKDRIEDLHDTILNEQATITERDRQITALIDHYRSLADSCRDSEDCEVEPPGDSILERYTPPVPLRGHPGPEGPPRNRGSRHRECDM